PLTGATIDGVMPRGMGQYLEIPANIRILNVFVNRVRLAGGTQLSVMVGTTTVGQITLNNRGEGRLRLNTANGDTVPTITADTPLTVKNGATTILSGTFRVPTPPTPTPTPTGSPSPSPSPTPTNTPHVNRFFGGKLTGAQVVPPVTTQGRGKIRVVLNQAETQIQVYTTFRNLSSAQTTATINGPAASGENGAVIFDLGAIGGTSGNIPVRTFNVTAAQVEQLRNNLWYVVIGTTNNANGEIRGQIRSFSHHSNFSGGDVADIAVYRPNAGAWYISRNGGFDTIVLGGAGDRPVSGDYDGDGNTDAAVFGGGVWTIRRSSDGGVTTRQWGLATDVPVSGDYDGDGRVDLTVFRPETGAWYIQRSSDASFVAYQFGANGDKPVAADLDGDDITDIVVFRPSAGDWYWLSSRDGLFRATHFGATGDVPVVADMDGDGSDDLTVFRPSVGDWYWVNSSDDSFRAVHFGTSGDIPVAANYDTDDRTDIAVFRPMTGTWYILRSTNGAMDVKYFGTNGDVPATAH
ncbi:MAG: CHRD domain-containing protein, partial [Acidobacteriota bacterium]|nr:CHRD domain-containing protein [Acidobacteriota bacterium]